MWNSGDVLYIKGAAADLFQFSCAGTLMGTPFCSSPSTLPHTPATTGRSTTRTASSGATMTGMLLTATTTTMTATACRPAASSAVPRQPPRKACLIWQMLQRQFWHRLWLRILPRHRRRQAPIARPVRNGRSCANRWLRRHKFRHRHRDSGPRDTSFWSRSSAALPGSYCWPSWPAASAKGAAVAVGGAAIGGPVQCPSHKPMLGRCSSSSRLSGIMPPNSTGWSKSWTPTAGCDWPDQ